jgi:purine-nucleoside phosphorylase
MIINALEKALDFRDKYEKKVMEAAEYIKSRIGDKKPVFGLVLGSGLGNLADVIENQVIIPYNQIPNFPTTTVVGHDGKLIIGSLEGVHLAGLKGRKHYYEVADEPFNNGILQVVFPVHVLAELGVKNYFTTHAAGGLNPEYKVGDMMVINSHISLLPNPLLGREHNFKRVDNNEETLRFQPMHEAYDDKLKELLIKAGKDYEEHVHEGVLLAVSGPTYETHAEAIAYRKALGADAAGMSVPPEVIVARNRGMKIVAFSCITDVIKEDGTNATTHEEVMSVLHSPEIKKRFESIVKTFFRLYRETIQQPL